MVRWWRNPGVAAASAGGGRVRALGFTPAHPIAHTSLGSCSSLAAQAGRCVEALSGLSLAGNIGAAPQPSQLRFFEECIRRYGSRCDRWSGCWGSLSCKRGAQSADGRTVTIGPLARQSGGKLLRYAGETPLANIRGVAAAAASHQTDAAQAASSSAHAGQGAPREEAASRGVLAHEHRGVIHILPCVTHAAEGGEARRGASPLRWQSAPQHAVERGPGDLVLRIRWKVRPLAAVHSW